MAWISRLCLRQLLTTLVVAMLEMSRLGAVSLKVKLENDQSIEAQPSRNDDLAGLILGISNEELVRDLATKPRDTGGPLRDNTRVVSDVIRQREMELSQKSDVREYDVIRSMPSVRSGRSGHNNCSIITFDLPAVSKAEQLVRAELMLYMKLRIGASRSPDTRLVRIYRVAEDGTHKELIGEKTIAFDHFVPEVDKTRWETFDVLPAVEKWLTGESNHGLHLDVLSNGESLKCGAKRDVHFVRGIHKLHRPILLVYSHDRSEPIRRYADHAVAPPPPSPRRGRRDLTDEQQRAIERLQADRNSANPRHCVRQSYTMDIRSVFGAALISPLRLDIGICNGNCLQPTSPYGPMSTHARLQSILHQNVSLRHVIPEPCCSPTELSSESFQYFHNGVLTFRTRHNIIVNGCGCR